MEKKIVFTPVEPNKNLLWLHYKNGLLVLQRFGSNGWEDITNSDQITEAEVMELIKDKANLVGGKVPAEELPSYVDDVIEFNNLQAPDTQISVIVGNNSYADKLRFVNGSSASSDRIGSSDKYANKFVNFGANTSEDDWTIIEPEEGKIYINTTNNHSYRWSGSQLIDLDQSWSNDIKDLQENTVRTDSQDLSVVQQKQAFENLGMKVYVTDSTFLGSTLTAEEIEQLAVSKALLFTDTGDLFLLGILDSNKVTFTRIKSNNIVDIITVTKSTGGVSLLNSYNFRDNEALHFVTQSPALTSAQQDVALSNIGLNWIHVPYSLLNTTLDDETYAKIKNAYGIILTDAPSEYYGPLEFICSANNSDGAKVFAGLNLANTSAYIVLSVNHNLTNVRYKRTYDGAVPYDTSKTLTLDQQDVALSNIGLNFVHVDYSLLGTTLTDEMFAVLNNAKGIILVDLPSNYYNPFVFIKGNNTPMGCIFVGFATGTTYCQIKLDKSTKILSNINANLTYIGAIRYIEKQSLTDTQKDTVLSNIGLDFVHVDYSILGTTVTDTQAQSIINSRGIILTNVPENSAIPTVYLKGLNDSNYCYFLTINGNTVISQISFNKSTKALSKSLNTDLHFDSIRYSVTQTLTVAQKQQARTNIGVQSADELLGDADFIAQLKTKLETA